MLQQQLYTVPAQRPTRRAYWRKLRPKPRHGAWLWYDGAIEMKMSQIIFALLLIVSIGCETNVEHKGVTEYWGVSIKETVEMKYRNGEPSYRIYKIEDEGLDGFWDSYTIWGERGRTQLYLDGKIDTAWYWANNEPTYKEYSDDHSELYEIAYDSLELKAYVVERIARHQENKQQQPRKPKAHEGGL